TFLLPHQLHHTCGTLFPYTTLFRSVNQVRFFPEGLTFASPASLTMSYANCDALSQLEPKQIAYTTDALAILALLPSVDVLSQQRSEEHTFELQSRFDIVCRLLL